MISDNTINLVSILTENGEERIGEFIEEKLFYDGNQTLYLCVYPDKENPEEYEIEDWFSGFEIEFFDEDLEWEKQNKIEQEIY